jgi:hypothetical protein
LIEGQRGGRFDTISAQPTQGEKLGAAVTSAGSAAATLASGSRPPPPGKPSASGYIPGIDNPGTPVPGWGTAPPRGPRRGVGPGPEGY